MLLSTVAVAGGAWLSWRVYRRATVADPLETRWPRPFAALRDRLYFDELYERSVIPFTRWIGKIVHRAEQTFFTALGAVAALTAVSMGWLSRLVDRFVIDAGFDQSCKGLQHGAELGRRTQHGNPQGYLRTIAVSFTIILLLLAWGCRGGGY